MKQSKQTSKGGSGTPSRSVRGSTAHIVALSGGKDSTALAVKLAEVEPRKYTYICTPTGDELPEMESHWNKLEDILQAPILRLRDPEAPTIYDLIENMNMLPNWRARWCTRILKIEVAQRFYEMTKPAVIYVGLRADENRKGNKLYDEDIEQRFPMQEWGWNEARVWQYLDEKRISIPRRTDCAMCFYQRIGEWWNLWKDYPEQWNIIEQLEDKYKHTLLSPGKFTNWPNKLSDMRAEFEKGRVPRGADNQVTMYSGSKCRVCTI